MTILHVACFFVIVNPEMADVLSGPSSGGAYYNEGEQENAYYCFTNPMRVPDRGIKIEELADFVLSANAEHEKYETEFKVTASKR